jgi:hypothetical protein
VQWRSSPVPVALGKVTSIRALLDWRRSRGATTWCSDTRASATATTSQLHSDGTLTYTDVGKRTRAQDRQRRGLRRQGDRRHPRRRRAQAVRRAAAGQRGLLHHHGRHRDRGEAAAERPGREPVADEHRPSGSRGSEADRRLPQPQLPLQRAPARHLLRGLQGVVRTLVLRARAHRRDRARDDQPAARGPARRGPAHPQRLGHDRPARQRRGPRRRRDGGADLHDEPDCDRDATAT